MKSIENDGIIYTLKKVVFMQKKRISMVLIIVLSITLIIMSFKYKSLLEEHNWQQTNVNSGVKGDLSIASSLFAGNSLTSENGKDYYYKDAISKIASASQLFQFSTYNSGLSGTLENLCTLMKQDEYKDTIIQQSKSIHEELLKLSRNPEDKQATDNLDNLVDEIRQKK